MIVKNFLKLYAVFISLLAIAYFLTTYFLYLENEAKVRTNEMVTLNVVEQSILRDFEHILPDLYILGKNESLRRYIETEFLQDKQSTEEDFSTFLQHKRIYPMLRYLDINGFEKIRLDFDGKKVSRVPAAQLQDKSNRYYFKETINLDPGNLFISPIDLNMEFGKIERPLKPMMRFAIPITTTSGITQGVLVINYLAERLLQHFDKAVKGSMGHISLLNKDGYWIRSHKQEREWGFMLNNESMKLSNVHPPVWEHMTKNKNDQFIMSNGLFTTIEINPIKSISQDIAGKLSNLGFTIIDNNHKNTWYVTSHVDINELNAGIYNHINGPIKFIWLAAVIISGLLSWILAKIFEERANFREQIDLHAKLFKIANEGIMITTPDCKLIDVNQGFTDITGFTREETLGKKPSILSSGQHDKAFYESMWKSINSNGSWEGEIINRKKDGTLLIEWLSISRILNRWGNTRYYIATFNDITQKKQSEKDLHRRAHFDALTGLRNKLSFEELLNQELIRSKRTNASFALLYIDLNRFKPINDTYGHLAGDQVLQEVGKRLEISIREVDIAGRIGGDEFAVLLPDIHHPEETKAISDRIVHALQQPISFESMILNIGASIGVAVYPINGRSKEELIKKADEAMYRAKRDTHVILANAEENEMDK